jgi:nicotinate-nucleotide adenylyltransferase
LTRLGLLGGTFDPPHYGHLLAAQEAAWQLDLSRVLFVPTRQNPLKRGEPNTDAEDRWRMVQLAIEDNSRFELSRLDLDRPGPSFTVDLVHELTRPGCELFFIVGGDILPELPRWHAPREILDLVTLVIANRPGSPPPDIHDLAAQLPGSRPRLKTIDMPAVDISSSDLRARVHSGQPIRYLTPPAVENYIIERGLYR